MIKFILEWFEKIAKMELFEKKNWFDENLTEFDHMAISKIFQLPCFSVMTLFLSKIVLNIYKCSLMHENILQEIKIFFCFSSQLEIARIHFTSTKQFSVL